MRSFNCRMLVAVATVLALPVLAIAAVTFNGIVPFSATGTNPCNGESVDLSGTNHMVISSTTDNSGGVHDGFQLNMHVTGTGKTTGANYVADEQEHFSGTFDSGVTVTETEPISFTMISQGSAPNYIIHALAHITINPDGTTTSYIDTYTSECRG